MFMFWSKRTILTRRLLKAKVCREYETGCETEENSSTRGNINPTGEINSACCDPGGVITTTTTTTTTMVEELPGSRRDIETNNGDNKRCETTARKTVRFPHACCGGGIDSQDDHDDDEQEVNCNEYNEDFDGRLTRCKELLKSLREYQLEMLLVAIDSCGADLSDCVLVPSINNDLYQSETNDQLDHVRRLRHTQRNIRHLHNPLRHRHTQHSARQRSRCRHCELPHNAPSEDTTEVLDESLSDENQLAHCARTSSLLPSPAHLLSCQIWRWPDLTHSSELKRLPICHSSEDPLYVCCNPYHWSRLCKPGK